MNKIENLIIEMIIEEEWRLSRLFMKDIEREFECEGKLPVNILLASVNLKNKWANYVRNN